MRFTLLTIVCLTMSLLAVPTTNAVICTTDTLRATVKLKISHHEDTTHLQKKSWWNTCPLTIRQSIYAEFFLLPSSSSSRMTAQKSNLPIIKKAPELAGLGTWLNGEPMTLASLRGKVVFIHFWTYTCYNCVNTLPHIQGYSVKYKDKPFILIGVHSPEFTFEKSLSNLTKAVRDRGLTYPIVQDNDFATWRAFENQYWPATYIIDAEGNIRYSHFGEKAYDEMDGVIAELLREIGA